MSGETQEAEAFLALVARLQEQRSDLTSLQSGLLAAAVLGIARDSRTFARLLGIGHALILRELSALAERDGLLSIVKRDDRTLRTHYALGPNRIAGVIA